MTFSRAVALVLVLAVLPVWPAAAQLEACRACRVWDVPRRRAGRAVRAAPPPQQPPPACQQLLTLRDETQKHGQALQAASQKKASPEELCKLFKVFLGAETKMLKGLETRARPAASP
jgi:hypothetical protein